MHKYYLSAKKSQAALLYQLLYSTYQYKKLINHLERGPSLYLHLILVILQTLLFKATYNWGIHKAINIEEAFRQSL